MFCRDLKSCHVFLVVLTALMVGSPGVADVVRGNHVSYELVYDETLWEYRNEGLVDPAQYLLVRREGVVAVLVEEFPWRMTYDEVPGYLWNNVIDAGVRDPEFVDYFVWQFDSVWYLVYVITMATDDGTPLRVVFYVRPTDGGTLLMTFAAPDAEFANYTDEFDTLLNGLQYHEASDESHHSEHAH